MRCIHCESENVIKNGFRINNLTKEKRQKPFCRECKKYFSDAYSIIHFNIA